MNTEYITECTVVWRGDSWRDDRAIVPTPKPSTSFRLQLSRQEAITRGTAFVLQQLQSGPKTVQQIVHAGFLGRCVVERRLHELLEDGVITREKVKRIGQEGRPLWRYALRMESSR